MVITGALGGTALAAFWLGALPGLAAAGGRLLAGCAGGCCEGAGVVAWVQAREVKRDKDRMNRVPIMGALL